MKKLRHLFTALLVLFAVVANAHDITIDGVYYNIIGDNDELEVTYYGDDEYYNVPEEYKYQGDLTISKKVVHGGVVFTVTAIGDYAFYNCYGLTGITVPNSVTSIGNGAFEYCNRLTSITIPNSVTSIGYEAFLDCYGLISITIPNSVTSIGERAFSGCTGLTSITIPNGVTSIGYRAFGYCSGLESIVVDSGNTMYDSRENCNAIIETESNTLIKGCNNSVIPNSVTSIGDYAFQDCSGLTSITIPNSVTSISGAAFINSGLESIVVEDGNTKYDSRENCNAIIETESNTLVAGCKNSVIPNSVTSIGYQAFWHCSGLTSITIPNSVTSIGDVAFGGCSGLTSVTIGNSVTSIGDYAFNGCENLKEVINLSNLDIVSGEESHGKVALYAERVLSPRLHDGVEFVYDNIKDFTTLYYTRTFENNDWQPWYMPFDVELSDIENELDVACLNNIHQYDDNEDDEIDRTELEAIKMNSGTLLANYPYIVKAKTAGEKEFVFEDVTVEPFENNSIDCSSVATKFTFTGYNNAIDYNSSYYALKNNLLSAATISMYLSNREVISLSQLNNDKVYTLRSARTFLLYSSNSDVADKLCTGNGKKVGEVSRDTNDANQHFKIENINGNYYLYSVAAGKYVSMNGTFVATPTDALTFENVGGEYQWKMRVGGNCLNSQDRGQIDAGILVDTWTTTDAGNCYIIEEVIPMLAPNRWYLNIEARNPMFKAPAQIRLFVRGEEADDDDTTAIESVEEVVEEVVVYDLSGRRVENPTNGIYIINGKKTLIR